MALFGAGWAVAIEVGIRVYAAELVALVGLLIIPWRPTLRRYPMARQVLGAYALWVLAIIVSDYVNSTPMFDSARNIGTPILGGLSLLFALTVVARNPNALLTFLAATCVAKALLGDASYGDTFSDMDLQWASVVNDTNFFKVRIDPFLTPAVLLLACWLGRKSYLQSGTLLIAASLGYFVVDARATGFMFFLSAFALVAIHLGFRSKLRHIVAASAVTLMVGYAAYVGYVNYTLTYNPNGHNGQQLARMENPYNPVELLLQGRSEWLVMTTAVAERPAFGWGSWALDPANRFAYLRIERSGSFEYGAIEGRSSLGYIPAHSLVGSAWVWSGFLAFVAMIWLFRSIFAAAQRLPFANSILVPAVMFLTMQITWHYFFSPPQHVRLTFPVALASLIFLSTQSSARSKPK